MNGSSMDVIGSKILGSLIGDTLGHPIDLLNE